MNKIMIYKIDTIPREIRRLFKIINDFISKLLSGLGDLMRSLPSKADQQTQCLIFELEMVSTALLLLLVSLVYPHEARKC